MFVLAVDEWKYNFLGCSTTKASMGGNAEVLYEFMIKFDQNLALFPVAMAYTTH